MADTMIPHAMRDIKKSLIVSATPPIASRKEKIDIDLKFR